MFQPRRPGPPQYGSLKFCADCRKIEHMAESGFMPGGSEITFGYDKYKPGSAPLPVGPSHNLAAPMRQVVFDIETYCLDRGWGVMLASNLMVHGGPNGTEIHAFDATQSKAWQDGKRSDDSELAAKTLKVLEQCHIAYAHNGAHFDIKYLNTVALKYGMPQVRIKIVDPCLIARERYRIGNNSLGAIADFLDLSERKMPVPADIWRQALMDADPASWKTLRERCASDVRVLNELCGKLTHDVGMIDYKGSWR